jgi:hypothetical protein
LLHESHSGRRPAGHGRPIHAVRDAGHILGDIQSSDGQRVLGRRANESAANGTVMVTSTASTSPMIITNHE